MNEMQIFESERFGKIRALNIDGEPWFVAADVCKALEIKNPTVTVAALDDDERAKLNLGRQGEANIVSEPGLYGLVMASRKKEAKAFKRWIKHEVLPSIRKNGGYILGQEGMSDAELMAQAVMVAKRTIEAREAKIQELEAQAKANAPKVIFADAVSASEETILVGELAKLLKQNGVENMGQNRLFAWLRENGYLIRREGTDHNMPTQRSMEMGLFNIKETAVMHSDGHVTVNKTPKVTGKGQEYFVARFLKSGCAEEA